MSRLQTGNKTALDRAQNAAMTITLVMVALIPAFFPLVPVHRFTKTRGGAERTRNQSGHRRITSRISMTNGWILK